MIDPWAGIAGFSVALAALAGVVRAWQRRAQPAPELPRKIMHVGTGLLALAFPWLFETSWPVVALAGASLAAMLAMRLVPALRAGTGQVLHAVRRESFGDLCFPAAVALLFVLARGDRLLFVIPMLVLALADATAALIGVRFGRNRYRSAGGRKSFEGSLAFFVVAFACAWIPLRSAPAMTPSAAVFASALIGLLVMLIEAASWRGLDNLFTPLLTFALVAAFRGLDAHQLLLRLCVLAGLTALLFTFRRRTRLDTGALLGSVVFFYVCWAVGGWPWLVAPLLFFGLHALLWPRGRRELPAYDGRTVFAMAVPGLLLLLVHVLGADAANGIAYAAMLAVVGADQAARRRPGGGGAIRTLGWCVVAGVVVLWPSHCAFAGFLAAPRGGWIVAIAAGALLYPAIDGLRPLTAPWAHRVTALCGLSAAVVAHLCGM